MRFRLQPTPAQEAALLDHSAHARFVWNLAVEQHQHWRPGRAGAPGYLEQCRQLTAASKEFAWLAAGSQTVQQQALRDFAQAMRNFFTGTHRRPTWRKAGRHEGFRIVGRGRQWDVRQVSRKRGQVWIPKIGWVRFRWSRKVPDDVRSFRATRDRAGRWVEKTSTDLARRFDVTRVEDLKIRNMVRSSRGTLVAPGRKVRAKAGLNRAIHASGWGRLVTCLEHKAPGRIEKIKPAYTSQTCHACGHCAAENRESQAVFRCRACGHTDHADVNAAKNIAVGRTVTARGGLGAGRPTNREPHLVVPSRA